MKKRFVVLLLATIMLTSSAAMAIEETNVYAENVIVDSDSTVINANTVVVNEAGQSVIKGTVIRSVNHDDIHIPFKPDQGTAYNIADVLKTKDYGFGTVVTSEFSLNGIASSREYDGTELIGGRRLTKEEYLLGGDILVKRDGYDFSTGAYSCAIIGTDGNVTYGDAMMMIYKAVGQSQYKYFFNYKSSGSDMPIGNTPFIELVPDSIALVDGSRYYTDVFTTRTDANAYWNAAVNERMFSGGEDASEQITLADFCYYLFLKMDREGEPVLTSAEESMILVAQGNELPIYLNNNRLEAVKHLMARGVVEEGLDFSAPVTAELATTILMRAKLPETRLTLKNVEYPYIASLVTDGYAPMDMKFETAPISDIRMEVTGAAVVSHLDYYIERNDKTIFHASGDSSRIISDVYVSQKWDDVSPVPYADTYTDVVENGKYYHLRVPISITENSDAFNNGTFTVNTANPTDMPENLLVEYGGGVYKWDDSTGKLVRSPFTSEFTSDLIDKERKENYIANNFDGSMLAPISRSVLFKFKVATAKDLENLLWDNKPLLEADKEIFSGVKDSEGNYAIKVEADDPYKYLLKHLTYKSSVSDSELVKAYIADDRTAMVSLRWLKHQGLVTDVTEIVEGKKWLVYSNKENTLIDLEHRIIVAGQTVIELAENDPSPFVVKDSTTGDMFIDYRAVNNMSSDYLLLTDDNGNISMTLPTVYFSGVNIYSSYQAIYPLLGEGNQSIMNYHGNTSVVSLEKTFPTANWLVYKKRSGLVNSEYLLVFRPDTSSNAVNSLDMQNFNISNFGLEEVKNLRINAYQIDMAVITDDDSKREKNFIIENLLSEAPGIFYDSGTSQYYYKMPTVTSLKDAYAKYMAESPEYPLPLVKYQSSSLSYDVNLNLNIYDGSETDLSKYPALLKNPVIPTSDLTNYEEVKPNKFILAIAGAQAKYYSYERRSWVDIPKASNVYFGSTPAKLDFGDSDTWDRYYKFTARGITLAYYPLVVAQSSKPFTEVFRGASKSVFTYGLEDQFRIVGFDQVIEEQEESWWPKFMSGGVKDLFDWEDYSLREWVNSIDDGITLANVFVLGVIPRLMMFIFIAFIVLSLVADNKLLVWFASRVIDPFKVLSFGLTSIEQVRTKNAWISVFVACVLLAMMSSGILELISWAVGFLQELLKS